MENFKINIEKCMINVRSVNNNTTQIYEFTDTIIADRMNAYLVRKGSTVHLKVEPKEKLIIDDIKLVFSYIFEKDDLIYMNGYQSWTDSKEMPVNSKMRGLHHVPKRLIKKYSLDGSGDYRFTDYPYKNKQQHGYSYGYVRENGKDKLMLFASLSENDGFTVFRSNAKNNTITVCKECAENIIESECIRMKLTFISGTETEVFDKWFEQLKLPCPKVQRITGYTSWYRHYQEISEKKILSDLSNMPQMDVFQIDDGYEEYVGDWLDVNKEKFPNGMKLIAERIRNQGFVPGIWLAPFVCERDSALAHEHYDWLVKDDNGEPVTGGANWSGIYALDLENEEVKQYLRKVFELYIDKWGFEFLKLDFLYAACIKPPKDKTRGQAMCEAMDFIRECTKDVTLLGCGVPLMPAFGKVEYCRIGCDAGLDWDDKPYMRLLHRERVSTKNSLANTIGRKHLNNRAFGCDPDVLLLRDDVKLSDEQRRQILKAAVNCGSMLFTSDDISDYDAKTRKMYEAAVKEFKNKEKGIGI